MPGLISTCQELFGTTDLYEVLAVQKGADGNAIKRGYHKVSLRCHPDRVDEADKETATQKFQALGKAYSILSDGDKRAVYDETGEVNDEGDIAQDRDWYDYWRLMFAKISVQDIKEFEGKYKESEEELSDLKSAYMDFEGDMDAILENVLCATIDDEGRFRKILQKCIKDGEVPKYPAFTTETKSKKKARKRKAKAEAAEAETYKEQVGLGDGDNALRQMIMQRKDNREKQADNFFAQLEAKYAKGGKKKKSK